MFWTKGWGLLRLQVGAKVMGTDKIVQKECTERSSWQRREVGEPAKHPPAGSRKRRCRPGTMLPSVLPAQENEDLEGLFPIYPPTQHRTDTCPTNVWVF